MSNLGDVRLGADVVVEALQAELAERDRLARRTFQALSAYWLGSEGLPPGRHPRGRYDSEDWWFRFERYRDELLALTAAAAGK